MTVPDYAVSACLRGYVAAERKSLDAFDEFVKLPPSQRMLSTADRAALRQWAELLDGRAKFLRFFGHGGDPD